MLLGRVYTAKKENEKMKKQRCHNLLFSLIIRPPLACLYTAKQKIKFRSFEVFMRSLEAIVNMAEKCNCVLL
jgi:hypothetical protein